MKKIGIIMAAAAMFLLSACQKDSASEVGKWYGYNQPGYKDDVAYVLDMKAAPALISSSLPGAPACRVPIPTTAKSSRST